VAPPGYLPPGAPPPYGAPPAYGAPPPYGASGYGAPAYGSTGAPLATYGARLGGWLIDWVILTVVNLVLTLPFRTHGHGLRLVDVYLIGAVIGIAYGTLMCGSSRAQTVGMMAVGAKAVGAGTGAPIGYGKALGRAAFEYLMAFVLFIPWIVDMLFPLWDARNQTLHDKVSNTVVVKI
jgi:uncharacterized RDD family membrane protein YckC